MGECEAGPGPLVFLSTLSAVDLHVLAALAAAHPRVLLLRLVSVHDPARPPLIRRIRAHPLKSLAGRLRDLVHRPLHRRMERRIELALFGPGGPPDPSTLGLEAVEDLPLHAVRDPSFASRLEALGAERLIVCGAPRLPEPVCTAARHGAFNVHFGIAPLYRGGNSIFWALYEGRRDQVGVTLHELTPRIDAGRIVGQAHVAVEPEDDETSLWAKCAYEAAGLVSVLASLPPSAPLEGRPQGEGGRLYRYADRTLFRELVHAVRRRLGRRPRGSTPAQRESPRVASARPSPEERRPSALGPA